MQDLPRTLFFAMLLVACDARERQRAAPAAASSSPSPAPRPAPTTTGSLAAARETMERFVGPDADPVALAAELTPKPGDAAVVFTGELAQRAEAHYPKSTIELAPAKEQTELLMWKATSEELREGKGDAIKCSERYRGLSLAPGLTWYCFRFVVPAEKSGTESEGLVFVNGRWALFPAPWEVK